MIVVEKVELKNIEESAIRLETQVNKIEFQVSDFWQQLDLQQAEINHQYLELNRLESEINATNKQLQSYPNRNIQEPQQQIKTHLKNFILKQGINQHSKAIVQRNYIN